MADEQVLGMHYFDHQFLRQADFETAQNYHVDRLRQHNRLLHLPGIVEGLQVTGTANTKVVQVTLGRAVDEIHQEVILRQPADSDVPPLLRVQTAAGFQEGEQHITGTALTVDLTSVPASSRLDNAVFITLRQGTKEAHRSQDPGTTDNTHLVERVIIEASTSAPVGAQLLLAQINRNADGTIQNVDLTERVLAGHGWPTARLPGRSWRLMSSPATRSPRPMAYRARIPIPALVSKRAICRITRFPLARFATKPIRGLSSRSRSPRNYIGALQAGHVTAHRPLKPPPVVWL